MGGQYVTKVKIRR